MGVCCNFEIPQFGEFLSDFFQTCVVGKLTISPFRWVSVSKLESNFVVLKMTDEKTKKSSPLGCRRPAVNSDSQCPIDVSTPSAEPGRMASHKSPNVWDQNPHQKRCSSVCTFCAREIDDFDTKLKIEAARLDFQSFWCGPLGKNSRRAFCQAKNRGQRTRTSKVAQC